MEVGAVVVEERAPPLRLARGPAQTGLVEIGSSGLEAALARSPEDWQDLNLVRIHGPTVDEMEIVLGPKQHQETRADGTWSARGQELLDTLAYAEVTHSSLPPVSGQPWGHIVLREGSQRTETVKIHQVHEGGGRIARNEAGGLPFLIPSETLEALRQSLDSQPEG